MHRRRCLRAPAGATGRKSRGLCRYDVEGIVAAPSTWMRNGARRDGIHAVLDACDPGPPNARGLRRGARSVAAPERGRAAWS